MSDVVFATVMFVVGVAVGRALRPTLATHESSAPPGSVEVVTGVLFAAVVGQYTDWRAVPLLVFVTASVALSVVDLVHYRLPNAILYPTLVAVVASVVGGELIDGGGGKVIIAAVVGALVYCGVLLVLHVLNPAGMGFGDVKLALLLGFVGGWVAGTRLDAVRAVMVSLFIASAAGVVLGLGRILTARLGAQFLPDPEEGDDATPLRKTTFPFGPPLMAGTLVVVLFRDTFLG